MFIVTGGAGFIGSALVWRLNQAGIDDILVVDRMGTGDKWRNLVKRRISQILHKDDLFTWLEREGPRHDIEAVFHLGASSSTTELDVDYLTRNNINYSVRLWQYCTEYGVPFIYASSAATYGAGEAGFVDDPARVDELKPLNPYGFSKQKFDQWARKQDATPPFWAGLKFFNVYGPQEYHKGGQTSVVFQILPQVETTGAVRLFKSYRSDYGHGEQKRDFVYVKDVVDVLWHLYAARNRAKSGIYNVGSGKARSFADLARAVFAAAGVSPAKLDYIDMPEGLRKQYQYFTEADLTRLREDTGYTGAATSLEDGVRDYVQNYLKADDRYL
jgi:ADP-L-glycero-D-manno-heptose 6-epimerase